MYNEVMHQLTGEVCLGASAWGPRVISSQSRCMTLSMEFSCTSFALVHMEVLSLNSLIWACRIQGT